MRRSHLPAPTPPNSPTIFQEPALSSPKIPPLSKRCSFSPHCCVTWLVFTLLYWLLPSIRHLRGEEAITTLGSIFREVDVDRNGQVTIEEMADWVEKEPRDGGGVRWRASVRRVLSTLASRVLVSRTEQHREDERAAGQRAVEGPEAPHPLVAHATRSFEALQQMQARCFTVVPRHPSLRLRRSSAALLLPEPLALNAP